MEVIKVETNKNKNYYFNQTKMKTKRYWSLITDREVINIYPKIEYQKFIGFGGAITEAAAYSYSLLPEDKKQQFMKDMFENINYSLCRITIGSCDFAIKSYSYAKKKDLSDFSVEKDMKYIVPFIKDAQKINPNIKFLASPWSPPRFMKNTKILYFGGKLLKKYKHTYAEYFVKYIQEYQKLGINIDYVTIQNEPNALTMWESCMYNAQEEADFATNYLYPAFKNNNIETKIIVYDHNKEKLFNRAVEEFSNEESRKAIAGIGFHWYSGNHFENIALVRQVFPEKLLFHTEGCFSYDANNDFHNQYVHDIIEDLNVGVNGYMDWNILLDSKGGPNHKKSFCNSPVMLNEEGSDYNKTLTYYYIGHISKFIEPGSVHIAHSKYISDLRMTAFKKENGDIVIVMANSVHYNINVNICIGNQLLKDTIESDSIVTYIVKNN